MKYGFNVYKTEVEGHVFWVAESEDLKGCVGQGENIEEALDELAINEEEWLATAEEYGVEIPEPTVKIAAEYSGKFMTRVSPKVHKEAAEHAAREGISLNQYVNNAIVAVNAANTTMEALKPLVNEAASMMLMSSSTSLMWKNNEKPQTLLYDGAKEYPGFIYKYQQTCMDA